jgi:glutaredoxin
MNMTTLRPRQPEASLRKITVYSRQYCHLCDEMLNALHALQVDLSFEVEIVDVDDDSELERRYGELVPVLTLRDEIICHYHLDVAKLRAKLG